MHQSSRLLSKTPALLVLRAIKGLTALTVKVIQVCYRDKLELRFQLLPSKTTYNILSNMADINECSMQGVCQNGDCLNTLGSFKCSCKAGWVLERNGCVGECLAQFHPILGSSCTNWNLPPRRCPLPQIWRLQLSRVSAIGSCLSRGAANMRCPPI